jgi:hypothetical protein
MVVVAVQQHLDIQHPAMLVLQVVQEAVVLLQQEVVLLVEAQETHQAHLLHRATMVAQEFHPLQVHQVVLVVVQVA